ncbi:MAG TPA: hypothetical protein VLG12_05345 [Candidatus Saccharimonadales bacterium]|nr:hypothetical protein [Candidatus Saccharimonadales bacterium]
MKKIFLLGRPGSGKSTASRYLVKIFKNKKLEIERINDFPLLKEMFLADREQKRFVPTEEGGFNATDFAVFDEVLQDIESNVSRKIYGDISFFTIEFARTNYKEALQQFSKDFLSTDSYVLFLDAGMETCLYRVRERVAHPKTADDHTSFSEDKFRKHYRYDNRQYMEYGFKKEFPEVHSSFIDTGTISLKKFYERLDLVASTIFEEYIHFS